MTRAATQIRVLVMLLVLAAYRRLGGYVGSYVADGYVSSYVERPTSTPLVPVAVTWENLINAVDNGSGEIEKTAGGTLWNGGGSSVEFIPAGSDGKVEWEATVSPTNVMCGLSVGNTNEHFDDIDFAIYAITTGVTGFFVYEGGDLKFTNAGIPWVSGDVHKVERVGTTIKYYLNDVELYESATASTSELLVDVSLNEVGAKITAEIAASPAIPGFVDLHSMVLQRSSSRVVSYADDAAVDLTGDMSIELWFKMDSHGLFQEMSLCSKADSNVPSSGWNLSVDKTFGGDTIFYWASGDGTGNQTVEWDLGVLLSTDTWYHLALTYDVSQAQAAEATLYLDAVDKGAPSITIPRNNSSIGTNAEPLEWGSVGGGDYFDGHICEARLWKDRILTGTEVSDGKDESIEPSQADLVNYTQIDGTTIEDVSDSGLTVTATGVTTSTDVPF